MHKQVVLALIAVAAGCAGGKRGALPDPAEAEAKVPAVEYRSPIADYRPHAEPELAPWRAANDEVGRVGGHVGMHRQGGATKPAAKPPAHGEHK